MQDASPKFQSALFAAALALSSAPALALDAAAVLQRASAAMGADGLQSIRYANEGTGYTFGQAYKPGLPWPMINIHSQVRTINYESGAMREEITQSRAEGRRRLPAGGAAEERPVHQRRARLEPDGGGPAAEKVTADKVADGVWFIAGGSHNSVAIEMRDHLILVEAPLNDGRTVPVLAQVKQLDPGKPIRYVINSHQHFDHSGGVRAALAGGATLITQAASKPWFASVFAVQNKIAPDQLAKSGKAPKFRTVSDKLALSDGARTIEIHRIKGSVHNDAFLMAYLPAEKLLIEADAYTPLPPNAPPPSPPNANNVNLVQNIERLKLAIEKILPLHGREVALADDLYAAVGRKVP